ncbi:MAG TPA: DUF4142 domain-containing protein [Acetobacteraceae bacterium]|jgi:putative membrane protein|nr:DUF4142 domain-containing protein [Acetobacteraceae bacterium]
MNTRSRTLLLLSAIMLPLAACGSSEQAGHAAAETGKPTQADLAFAIHATAYDIDGIQFSQLAQTKTNDSALRDLAARIVQTNTDINRQLAALAQAEAGPLPSGMDQQHQAQYAELQSMNGPGFNRAWLNHALPDQTMAIETFQAEADTSKYPPFRDLAQQTLPALLANLQTTQQLSVNR